MQYAAHYMYMQVASFVLNHIHTYICIHTSNSFLFIFLQLPVAKQGSFYPTQHFSSSVFYSESSVARGNCAIYERNHTNRMKKPKTTVKAVRTLLHVKIYLSQCESDYFLLRIKSVFKYVFFVQCIFIYAHIISLQVDKVTYLSMK